MHPGLLTHDPPFAAGSEFTGHSVHTDALAPLK
jgi:hypothetical protein